MNRESYILQQLVSLAGPDKGWQFSINPDADYEGYYIISVGPHEYICSHFHEENLFLAWVYILSSIRKQEDW